MPPKKQSKKKISTSEKPSIVAVEPPEAPEPPPDLVDINLEDKLPVHLFFQTVLIRETEKYAKISKTLCNYAMEQKSDDIFFITKSEVIIFIRKESALDDIRPYQAELKKIYEEYIQRKERIPLNELARGIKLKIWDSIITEQLLQEEEIKRKKLEEMAKLEPEPEPIDDDEKTDNGNGKKGAKGKKDKGKKGDKGKKEKGKNGDKDKGKKKGGKKGKNDEDDDPIQEIISVVEEPRPIAFYYYVLYGFNDINILTELQKINVEIGAIIDFCPKCSISNRPINIDNLIIINYIPRSESSKSNYVDFEGLIKLSLTAKQEHLKFMKHTKLYQFRGKPEVLSIKHFDYYNKLLDCYPTDCITIPIILDAIIEEIVVRAEDKEYDPSSVEDLVNTIAGNPKCCTCRIKKPNTGTLSRTFRVHEEDLLGLIRNTYRGIGKVIHDKTLEYIEKSKIYSSITPPERVDVKKKNQIVPPDENVEEDTESLHEYFDQIFIMNWLGDNRYEWKEDLNSPTFFQLLSRAEQEYTSFDYIYNYVTDTFFLRFFDNFDSTGICSTTWSQHLLTPLCLKDFFMYHFDINDVHPNENVEESSLDDTLDDGSRVLPLIPTATVILPLPTQDKKKEIINSLLNYPKSDKVKRLCRTGNQAYVRIAYDLGWERLQLTGNTTIFESYDGVKITLDDTKFLSDRTNCFRINLKFTGDHYFTFDSKNTNPLNFSFLLSDGTIIYFSQPPNIKNNKKAEPIVKKIDTIEEEQPNDRKVMGTNWLKFNELLTNDEKEEEIDKEQFLDNLKDAQGDAIYKVSKGIKRSITDLTLSTVINRVLPATSTLLAAPDFDIIPKESNLRNYNFKMTLPTGGTITAFYVENKLVDVKHDDGNDNFRIFCPNGEIIAKYPNGSIKIYRPNGDLIILEKPLNAPPACPVHNCACEDVKTYQNILNKMFGSSDYKPSRGIPPLRERDDLGEFADAPFRKKTLLKFNGLKVVFENGEYEYLQNNFVLLDNDFLKGEKYFERDDKFKCCLKIDSQEVLYPDGTQIIMKYDFEDRLVAVEEGDTEGWVVVFLKYDLSTPEFAKTFVDPTNQFVEIFLNRFSMKIFPNCYKLEFPNTEFWITRDDIKIRKRCNNCLGKFVCTLNMKPFYVNEREKAGNFLEARDSYSKHITVDFNGKYDNYDGFNRGATNNFDCDHYRDREAEKLFVMKRNDKEFMGSLLWSDAMIDKWKIINKENVEIKNYYNNLCKREVTELFRKYYTDFQHWYIPSSPRTDISLSKKAQKPEDNPHFITYRLLKKIPSFEDVEKTFSNYMENTANISENIERHYNKIMVKKEEEERVRKDIAEKEHQASELAKIPPMFEPLQPQFGLNDSVISWRRKCNEIKNMITNKQFSPYFKSEYCKKV